MAELALRWPPLALLLVALIACGARETDHRVTILVGGDVNHEAVHTFERARGRPPTHEELLGIHGTWIDNEILYREGSKLPFDAATGENREQVIFRALAAIGERTKPASVTDEELRRWFEGRRAEYAQPARFDFEDATPPGERSEVAVRTLADALNHGGSAALRANIRAFKGRPESNLVQSYGPEVASALAKSSPGTWLPLRASDGWRAMRLSAATPTTHAAFEPQREAIRRDWTAARASELRREAVQALRAKYKIEFAPPFECHADK